MATRTPFKLDQLGSVGRGRSRHRPRNDPSLYGGDIPFFQTGDVKAAELYLHDYTQTYNDKGLAQSKLWQPGTICITIAANIAESAVLTVPGCFPDSVVGFIPYPDKSDGAFIKYYIDTLKLQMQSASRGTTQDNLSLDKLLTFDFLVPEVGEQRRIASILSAYDDLIENNTRRIAILEEMARRIYEEWFVRFRFPGHEQVKKVESELGLIPEGWDVGCLNNVVRLLSGFAFKTQDFVDDGDYGLVTIKNVQDGEFVTECTSRLAGIPKKMAAHCELKTGDCLLSLTGNVGRCCTVIGHNYLLNQRVAKLHPVRMGDKAYVYFLFRSETTRKSLEAISNGVAQQNLSPIQTEKLPWIIPSIGIRSEFDTVVTPLLDLATTLRLKNRNLRTTRDLLLPKLISGELDVSIPSEPEEAIAA